MDVISLLVIVGLAAFLFFAIKREAKKKPAPGSSGSSGSSGGSSGGSGTDGGDVPQEKTASVKSTAKKNTGRRSPRKPRAKK